MADGMAKVQAGALALLVLIVFHHVLLHAQGTVDDALNVFFGVFTLKQGKQLRVSNQTRLDGPRQAVDKVAAGQRCQGIKIHQHHLGLPESANNVFGFAQVNGGFAANGGIDLGKGGGGAVDKINAAHIRCRAEPAQIPHNAAAHGDQQILAVHAERQHGLQHLAIHFQAFAGFALGHSVHHSIGALGQHGLGILLRHAGIRQDKHLAVGNIGKLVQVGQAPAFQDDIIAAAAKLHGQFHNNSSRVFPSFTGQIHPVSAPCGTRFPAHAPAWRNRPLRHWPGRQAEHKNNIQTEHGAADGF